jgi:quercetin dioxygenase-like cupin family protein
MRPALIALGPVCAALAACAHMAPSPQTAWTDTITFAPVGFASGVDAAFILGSQNTPGLYTIRVRILKDGKMPPHTHPDTRMITVIAGEVYYGFGDEIDLAAARLYKAGDTFLVPANAPHFAWAKTSDVIYQEAGTAPTATVPLAK